MSSVTASHDAFFNAIVDQRALEFAGESLRKADLIRWNLLKAKLDEAKTKMAKLINGDAPYDDLPQSLYYKYKEDGETLDIYGLNHGETDAIGATKVTASGYTKSSWRDKADKLPQALIDALYQKNPDENQYWPIWQTFVDSSNGTLSNN